MSNKKNFIIKETKNYLQFKELFTSSGLEFNLDETGEKPEGFILAYECKTSGGDLLGAAAICKRKGYFILQDIAVKDAVRGNHLGEMLLLQCMGKIEALGADQIYLTAKEPKFFEKYGFRYISNHNVPDIFSCLNCRQYGTECMPKFMAYSFDVENVIPSNQ